MRRRRSILFAAAVTVLLGGRVDAENTVKVAGQVRPRFEFRDPVGPGYDTQTSSRVRLAAAADLDEAVKVFVQIQDVRLWGEETNTLGDFRADNLDLHQGYVEFGGLGSARARIRIGRQEIALGGQRLIGSVNWTQQGRAFDGVLGAAKTERAGLTGYIVRLSDATAATATANATLMGGQATLDAGGAGSLDLYGIYNRVSGAADTDQFTLGGRLAQTKAAWPYRFEISFQTGTRGGQDVSAYLVGGRIGTRLGPNASLTSWYDLVSGDADPGDGKAKVFDTLFATNHKFYGFADLFLNLPVHTGGLGLQDAAVKLSTRPRKDVVFGVDVHLFRTARKGSLTSSHLGEEVDLTLAYTYTRNARIVAGLSYVRADDAMATLRGITDDVKFAYVMTDVSF